MSERQPELGIRGLLDRYHASVNHRDWDLLGTLFVADGIWEVMPPIGLRYQGKAEIEAGIRASISRQELLIQSNSGVVISARAGNRASVRSTLTEFGRETADARGWSATAFCYDEVVLDGDIWRFQNRVVRLHFMTTDLHLPGPVYAAARGMPPKY